MPKPKALFICVHNSARSQMAAALMNKMYGDFFEAQSAGLEPGSRGLVLAKLGLVQITMALVTG